MTEKIKIKKTVLVPLADGFEEIEAVTIIDILRRAEVEVIVAGVGKREIIGAHGITVGADVLLEQYQGSPDAVVLPGGMPGAKNLKESEVLKALLLKMKKADKLIGAICASPAVVLASQGLLDGKKATCYPGFENELGPKVTFSPERVVRDGQIITSRGPGTALEFSLELVKELMGPASAEKILQATLAKT